MSRSSGPKKPACSFCGKTKDQAKKLIAGTDVYICDRCVALCNEIILDDHLRNVGGSGATTPVRSIDDAQATTGRPNPSGAPVPETGATRSPAGQVETVIPQARDVEAQVAALATALGERWRMAYGVAKEREALSLASRRPKEALYPRRPEGKDAAFVHVGFPGEEPFTRGIYPSMYRERFWTMRQYSGMASPEETNKRFRYLLAQGQTGLSVAFDLPTQLGMDSDEPLALGEVGRVGVPVPTLADFGRVFEGIPLERVSVSMTINATAIILLSMLVALGRRRGIPPENLSGTVQNDILKEYIARGTYIYPLEPSMRLVTDTIAYATDHLPRFNPISISGYHIREAGATAVQELAFTFGNALAYVEACRARGLDVERLARRLSFFFNAHSDFLEEVAKFRAARRIWCRLLRDRFGVTGSDALRLRFHTQTAGATLTAAEPMNNVVRVTLQALAAVLGGTQSLHTNALDEALALPTPESAQLALRTQQIIAHESGVADTIDPLGGSWAIETLTSQIERETLDLLAKVDARGGMIASIEDGYVTRAIQESAYTEQREIEEKKRIVVGVNAFTGAKGDKGAKADVGAKGGADRPGSAGAALAGGAGTGAGVPVQKIDPSIEEGVRARLVEHKARRDASRSRSALAALVAAARTDVNLVEPIVAALLADATLGEIAHALRSVFGEHKDTSGLAR